MSRKKDVVPGTLHKAGEDYLEAILVLHKNKGLVRSVDVANYLHYSKPSVCNAVAVLRQAGYLTMDGDHFLYLTDEGLKIAERIYGRHQLISGVLEKLGVDAKTAEADACRIEHVISPETCEKLREALEKGKF